MTVELRPDAGLGDAIEAAERQRLEAARAAMSDAELEQVVEATKVRAVWHVPLRVWNRVWSCLVPARLRGS